MERDALYIAIAESIAAHDDCPEKARIVQDALDDAAEKERRGEISEDARERIFSILDGPIILKFPGPDDFPRRAA